jgi:hypothetical protein
VDDLVVGDVVALEVALHQRLGVLGHLVHQLLAVLGGERGELVRDRDLRAVVLGGAVVGVRLHVDEVDQARDLLLGADRDLGGDDVRAEGILELAQHPEEVRALAVEHVDVEEPGHPELLRTRPQPPGPDLHPEHAVDHEDRDSQTRSARARRRRRTARPACR